MAWDASGQRLAVICEHTADAPGAADEVEDSDEASNVDATGIRANPLVVICRTHLPANRPPSIMFRYPAVLWSRSTVFRALLHQVSSCVSLSTDLSSCISGYVRGPEQSRPQSVAFVPSPADSDPGLGALLLTVRKKRRW